MHSSLVTDLSRDLEDKKALAEQSKKNPIPDRRSRAQRPGVSAAGADGQQEEEEGGERDPRARCGGTHR